MKKTIKIFLLSAIISIFAFTFQSSYAQNTQELIYLHKIAPSPNSTLDIFNSLIKDGNCIVIFSADWCGPCKRTTPIIEDLVKTFPKITFIKVDIERCRDTASQFNIKSIPTIMFFKNGNIRRSTIGAMNKSTMLEVIKTVF